MTDLRKAAQEAAKILANALSIDFNDKRDWYSYKHDVEYATNLLLQALAQTEQEIHCCELNSPYEGYGEAINDCIEDDERRFWVGNGEYGSQVNYCPVCGTKAPKQIEGDTHD